MQRMSSDPGGRGNKPVSRFQGLIYGLLCMPVGVAIGLYVSGSGGGENFQNFPFFAGLSAFLAPAFFWWLIIQRSNMPTTKRAISVGLLGGLLSHWLCWYLMLLWANVDFWLLGGSVSSLGEAPMNPLLGLAGVFAYCIWSWWFFGWITVAAGVVLALIQARSSGTQSQPV